MSFQEITIAKRKLITRMRFKEYLKISLSGNRFSAPVYFYLTLPYFTYKFRRQIKNNLIFNPGNSESMQWEERIKDVLECPDNRYIVRDPNAGKIINNRLIMHNGLKVHPLSYYGKYVLKMLIDNKGVHEPQEERAFQDVLKEIPGNAKMMELGSYWSFYSMWFNKAINGSTNFMIEPNPICMESGKLNFRVNKLRGRFLNCYLGSRFIDGPIPTVSVDYLVNKLKIDHLHILHSDIQGFEYEMLKGCDDSIKSNKISYFFISTHSDELHEKCSEFLRQREFQIIASANSRESYSVDGIIVAKAPFILKPVNIAISLKPSPEMVNQ